MLKTWIDDVKDGESYAYFHQMFHELGINDLFEWFYDHNTARNNPYHNNVHTFIVVDLIHQYCIEKGIQGQLARTLHIAALYHDFGHSSGKLTDEENIKIACDGLIRAKHECGYDNLLKILHCKWCTCMYALVEQMCGFACMHVCSPVYRTKVDAASFSFALCLGY